MGIILNMSGSVCFSRRTLGKGDIFVLNENDYHLQMMELYELAKRLDFQGVLMIEGVDDFVFDNVTDRVCVNVR